MENPTEYTDQYFYRSSATVLVNYGADITSLVVSHGIWKSSNFAEGYIKESRNEKVYFTNKIFSKTTLLFLYNSLLHITRIT